MLYARARVCAYYFAKSIRKVTQEHFDRDDFHPFCWTCDITRSIGFRPPAQKCFICSDKFRFCTHTGTRECTLTRSHTLAHSHTRTQKRKNAPRRTTEIIRPGSNLKRQRVSTPVYSLKPNPTFRKTNHKDRHAGRGNAESGAHLCFDIVLKSLPMLLRKQDCVPFYNGNVQRNHAELNRFHVECMLFAPRVPCPAGGWLCNK